MIRNAIKLIAQRMLLESGVDLHFSRSAHRLRAGGQQDNACDFGHQKRSQGAGGKKYVIDSTGDGDLCAMAGVPMQGKYNAASAAFPVLFVSAAWIRTLWS